MGRRPMTSARAHGFWLAALLLGGVGAAAAAQPPADQAASYDAKHDTVVCIASSRRNIKVARLAAARVDARRDAESTAKWRIHAFVDGALADARVSPAVAVRMHAAVDAGGRVVWSQPLADGGMVVRFEVPAAPLRDGAPAQGLPWAK